MELWCRQLNGETFALEVTPEMTAGELKQRIIERRWHDALTRKTTLVQVVVADGKLLRNDATLADVVLPDSYVTIVFKDNAVAVTCSNRRELISLLPDVNQFKPLGDSPVVKLTIPEYMTSILHLAFQNCPSLASMTIPNSVIHINKRAFQNCVSLASVTVPNSVTHVGDAAFEGCSSLECLSISSSVNVIPNCAFRNCSSLASVTIPNSVTRIGDAASRTAAS